MAESRDAFSRHAPVVVQALALLDEDRPGGYATVRHLHPPPDDQYVRVHLDARGRAALSAYFRPGDPTVTTDPFVVTISGIDFYRHRTTVTVETTGRAIGEAHAVISVSDRAGHAEKMITQDCYADVKSAFRLDIRGDLRARFRCGYLGVSKVRLDVRTAGPPWSR